jgi:hypothetical protein
MQQYAGIYLLQNHSACFGCPSHQSSGVHKTETAASGTGNCNCNCNLFVIHTSKIGYKPVDIDTVTYILFSIIYIIDWIISVTIGVL